MALVLRDKPASKVEDRLDLLTGTGPAAAKDMLNKPASVLSQPLDDAPGFFDRLFERFGNIGLLFEQADTSLTLSKLLAICAAMGGAGVVLGMAIRIHIGLAAAGRHRRWASCPSCGS